MNWEKTIKMTFAAAAAALSLAMPQAFAAEEPTIVPEVPTADEQQQMTEEELLQRYIDSGYKYTSQRYGYTIVCPRKPSVVPASMLFDEKEKGDVLIFKSTGTGENTIINYAWVIRPDAFDESVIPPDITKQAEAKQKEYLDKFMKSSPYEFIRLTEVDGRSGVYAVTAKEIEVDTNGDGKMDEIMRAESQMIQTYFRGAYGGRFGVMLMENPDLTKDGVAIYQLGVLTFQEWPTKMQNGKKNK
jgi:hypothetical protein